MSYTEALGAVVYGVAGAFFGAWYVWCAWTMLIRCKHPREFFTTSYSTSGPFAIVNIILAILGTAWVLMMLT